MTKKTVFEIKPFTIAADEDCLLIRGPLGTMIFGLLFGGVFIAVGIGLAWIMLTKPGTDWTPRWKPMGPAYPLAQHPFGDRLATYAAAMLFGGLFASGGVWAVVMSSHLWLFPWRFDKRGGYLQRRQRTWKISEIRGASVKTDTFFGCSRGASVMLDFDTGPPLRVVRSMIGKGHTLRDCQTELQPHAAQIAQWLGVPLRMD
jgi:hypothetical protein